MVIAMPSDGLWGDGSGYLPHHQKDFEKWIVDDVPEAVRHYIPIVSEQSPMFISGLSMGGFGALRLGLKYPDKFQAISAHSSITHLDQMSLFVEEELAGYYQADTREHSVVTRLPATLPKLRFDCGTDDSLLEHNRALHHALTKKKVPHIYEEFEGGHQWSYWQKHLVDTLLFFNVP